MFLFRALTHVFTPTNTTISLQEDSCGPCRNNDTLDYVSMHEAIVAAGRPMVQTDEGAPDNANCSATMACGNAKRVGHDISPSWLSMMSLVDIGSGLWPFAHNSTGQGGWWNDLDSACSAKGGQGVGDKEPPRPSMRLLEPASVLSSAAFSLLLCSHSLPPLPCVLHPSPPSPPFFQHAYHHPFSFPHSA